MLDANSFDVDIKLSSFRRSGSKSRVTEQVPKHVLEFLAPEELGGSGPTSRRKKIRKRKKYINQESHNSGVD